MSNEYIVANALLKTAPELYASLNAQGAWTDALKKRGARVDKYRRYERGDHDNNLTDTQKTALNISTDEAKLNDMTMNFCPVVIDMFAGRLSVPEITSEDDDTQKWIDDVLIRNRFTEKEGEWYRGAIRDMESFVFIDPRTAVWTSEPAYNGHNGVIAEFDKLTGLPIWMCKLWSVADIADISTDEADADDEEKIIVVVYQPDRITYWQADNSTNEVIPLTIAQESTLKRLIDGSGNEINGYDWSVIGVCPAVQFANKRDNWTSSGDSELRNVVPLQDGLNSALIDKQMASRLSAFKIYWSIGVDVDGNEVMPGSFISVGVPPTVGDDIDLSEEVLNYIKTIRLGEFSETNMTQYEEQINGYKKAIAEVSSTPLYGITESGNLSGDALKQLQIGLVNKIIRFQRENTQAIISLLKLTAEVQRQFNVNQSFSARFKDKVRSFLGLNMPVQPPKVLGDIDVVWKSPEIVDISTQIETFSLLRKNNPGLFPDSFYRNQIGALLGMSSAKIDAVGMDADAERSNTIDSLLGNGSLFPEVQ